jgi:ketosteroid isomerase-like protein
VENVDVVRRCIETFATDEGAWLATLDPEMAWHPHEEGHIPVIGHEQHRESRRRWLEDWADYEQEIADMYAGADDFVAALRVHGRGRESGIEVETRIYLHLKLRDGLVTYMYEYTDLDDAVRAAGLA